MRFSFIRVEKAFYPLVVLCRVLEVSRSGYYAFEKRGPSKRETSNCQLMAEIRVAHKKSRRSYGSPRIHRELRAQNRRVGRKRIARLMQEAGIVGRRRHRFCRTTDSDHGLPVAENILDRKFETSRPNQAWVADITYIPTMEGWLYLAVLLDLFSRRVVGYAMSHQIDGALVLEALRAALRRRRGLRGLLHHTDQGSQYASDDYQAELRAWGITCSMSRRGNCWDNAVAESFFGPMKDDLGLDRPYSTREIGRAVIADYIDGFYNPERRHSTLDYRSPIEYELMYQIAQVAA
jgi:transposase InsO family protein